MKTLVAGASGATGKHLVNILLQRGHHVKVIVRSADDLPKEWKNNDFVTIILASILSIPEAEMAEHVKDCDAVACCLGHNISFKGIYGKPRKLVTDATRLLCQAIEKIKPQKPVKFVLMNTVGNRNRDLNEPISLGQKMVVGLLRLLVPPHPDNEKAADYLRVKVGQNNPHIKWVAVRPDSLLNQESTSAYSLHASPTRSAIFNPGKTSRINVGHFMAALIEDDILWQKWQGQMPVIYNKEA